MQEQMDALKSILENSISKCTAKHIALSGGLDSSILAHYLKQKDVKAFAIIAKDFVANDLTYCQLVSKEFSIPLEIKTISTEDLLSGIEETIKILENFNDIEVRNSVPMYLCIKAAKDNGATSIITGDGADELFAGYNFLLKNDPKQIQKELERIWSIMHFPAQKIGESLGVKIESPYLDEQVIEYAKKIPPELKVKEEQGKLYGKWILRKAFEGLLPKSIIWRTKSPLEEGTGTAGLVDLFNATIRDELFDSKIKEINEKDDVIVRSKESLHYYQIYRKYFDVPSKRHSSNTMCPFCKFAVMPGSKFCRMCGSYPI